MTTKGFVIEVQGYGTYFIAAESAGKAKSHVYYVLDDIGSRPEWKWFLSCRRYPPLDGYPAGRGIANDPKFGRIDL